MIPLATVLGIGAMAWLVDALLRSCGDTAASLYLVAKAPGTVMHEAAHALACVLFGVHVHRVVFFQRVDGEPSGFVEHVGSPHVFGSMAISLAPALLGVVLATGFVELATIIDTPFIAGTCWYAAGCMVLSSRPSGTDIHHVTRAAGDAPRQAAATIAGLAAGVFLSILLPLSWAKWWQLALHLLVILLPGWACCKLVARTEARAK